MNDKVRTDFSIIPADHEAVPYYQPILAMDTRRIIGYEVLGRRVTAGSVTSLGPFFTAPQVDPADQMRIDRLLRERAIAKLGSDCRQEPMLFVNVKPSWIEHTYRTEGELPTLRMLAAHGIDPSRITVEVMEEAYGGSMRELRELIDIYRRAGCRIAIDDIGTGFSSADRIAAIQPDILKIDIHLMKKSASHNGYLAVLRSFSALAEQIGASLLIEGVETHDDLQRAIQLGARYVQGYLFAPAEPDFREPDDYRRTVDEGLAQHRRHIRNAEELWRAEGERLASWVDKYAVGFTPVQGASPDGGRCDALIERMLGALPAACIRVYYCGTDGVQRSSNFRRVNGQWQREPAYRGANWSWRPYFVADLLQLTDGTRAHVSRSYADLDTRGWIRTLSAAASEDGILFFDYRDDEPPASSGM